METQPKATNGAVQHPHLEGLQLLNTPVLNKGTAFTDEERTRLGLHGLLPPHIEALEDQAVRVYQAFQSKDNDLERHIYLRALQDTNEVLFYRLLLEHVEEMMPIIYTPVVAQACQHFSHIYRQPRGLFLSFPLRASLPTLLRNRPNRSVDIIVVTDGEHILGIGDQGVGGMGIPIGKLSLYSLFGGIRPSRTLPIVLDVGTNNPERLRDPEYLGWRHARVGEQDYFDLIDQFVRAVQQELPYTFLHWDDLTTPHARPILEHYRGHMLTYNDDIQGTGAVVLSTILGALPLTGRRLSEQQIVFLGAGTAAIGVADYLRLAMQDEGLSAQEAASRIWLIDINGLVHSGRTDLTPQQRVYAQPATRVAAWPRSSNGQIGLLDAIGSIDATILIGLSTAGGAFTETIVRQMARKVEHPIILPLSNPTAKAEARPEDLLRWTEGRALVATGSPFPPISYAGRTIRIAECNNVYISSAVGLALVASRARHLTDEMVMVAARALAEHAPIRKDAFAPLLPTLSELRHLAVEIAVTVSEQALRSGLVQEATPGVLRQHVVASQWFPAYASLEEDLEEHQVQI